MTLSRLVEAARRGGEVEVARELARAMPTERDLVVLLVEACGRIDRLEECLPVDMARFLA